MKNQHHFFNWQGNKLEWQTYFPWIFLGIALVIWVILFFTKDKIKKRFDRGGKFLWFKSDETLWRAVGIIGLAFTLFRTIFYASTKYPLYWTNFNLHLCRIHVMIVFSLMAIGKFRWIKYITYVSTMGVIAGFYFGSETSDIVNNHDVYSTSWDTAKATPGYEHKIMDELLYKDKFQFFSVGPDNWWLYDFVFAHLSITFFPIFIRIAYGQKFTSKELNIMQLSYIFGIIVIWSLNSITDQLSDPHWRMNNWYIGDSNANDNIDTLGWLSGWPQNVFTYTFLGIATTYVFHFLWMFLDKFHFFTNNKIVTISKSKHWEEYKQERSIGWSYYKNIFKR